MSFLPSIYETQLARHIGSTVMLRASTDGRLPAPTSPSMGMPLRLTAGRSSSMSCIAQGIFMDRRRDSGAVQSKASPHPQISSRTSPEHSRSISALDNRHNRLLQRPGRRRLHVCGAGGPSKKLGVSSPRGQEVPVHKSVPTHLRERPTAPFE